MNVTIQKADADAGEVPSAVTGLAYDGEEKALVTEGKSENGIYQYRLGPVGEWSEMVPSVKEAGFYTVYFYLKGDKNHKDAGSEGAPKGSISIIISSPEISTLSGRVFQADGATGREGILVRLMKGNEEVVKTMTSEEGGYQFAAENGFYNLVVEWENSGTKEEVLTKTLFLTLEGDMERDVVLPSGEVSSILEIGENTRAVVAGGLDEEAEEIQNENGGKEVTVTMSVEEKEEKAANGSDEIKELAADKKLEFFDITVQKHEGTDRKK